MPDLLSTTQDISDVFSKPIPGGRLALDLSIIVAIMALLYTVFKDVRTEQAILRQLNASLTTKVAVLQEQIRFQDEIKSELKAINVSVAPLPSFIRRKDEEDARQWTEIRELQKQFRE